MNRLGDLIKKHRSIKGDLSMYFLHLDSAEHCTKEFAASFADWLNNNWFMPTEDGFWKLDTNNIEYSRTIPAKEVDLFSSEELVEMYANGEGED